MLVSNRIISLGCIPAHASMLEPVLLPDVIAKVLAQQEKGSGA